MKSHLVASLAERRRRIEPARRWWSGQPFTSTEPSPLASGVDGAIQTVDPAVETGWRRRCGGGGPAGTPPRSGDALGELREAAKTDANLMVPTLRCAGSGDHRRVGRTLREVFGEYRAPTGVSGPAGAGAAGAAIAAVRERVHRTAADVGRPRLRLLVGKPGLDGHSNGASRSPSGAATSASRCLPGIRLTPAQIVAAAVAEDVDVVGLSVLSGSHLSVVPRCSTACAPPASPTCRWSSAASPGPRRRLLRAHGVARVFTAKDYALTDILDEIVTRPAHTHRLPPA